MSAPTVEYLVEIVAYDPDAPGTTTLRYSTIGKVTGPAETPANTHYDERLTEPGDIRRAIAEGRELFGAARIAVGEVVLNNHDGALDALAAYGFDGRAITIRRGTPGAAYPGGYTTVYVGTMDDCEVTRSHVRIRLRDNTFGLDQPLQTTKYAGSNVLPAGLEGVADDLKGKPKPLLFGVAKNLPVPCVNTANLIYQVSDGAIASVEGVYDKGIELGASLFVYLGYDEEGLSSGKGADFTRVLNGIATFGAQIWRGGCSDATNFIAVGSMGAAIWSADGQEWEDDAVTGAAGGLFGISFGGSLYVVCGGDSGTGIVRTSPGPLSSSMTWTTRTHNFTGGQPRAVCHNGTVHCVVGTGGQISTSADGVTWTAQTSGTASDFHGVTSDGDLLVAVGAGGIIYSCADDGVTWVSRTSGVSTVLRSVIHDGAQFVAAGDDGAVTVSADGLTWVARIGAMPTTFDITCLAFGDDTYIATGRIASGPRAAYRSTDTIAWTPIATGLPTEATSSDRDYGVVLFRGDVIAGTYANATDLADDDLAPLPGMYRAYLGGGLIRLGSPPAGLVTVDATQGATAADRTAGSLFENVLTKAGFTSANWTTGDVTALDSADNSEIGIWLADEVTTFDVLDQVAATVGAWWGTGDDGKFRIVQWTAPSGSAVLTLTENDTTTLERLPSDRPVYRTVLQYARNYVVQDRDVAFGVTDARRAALAKEWREAFDLDASVQTMHLLAEQTVEPSLYSVEADADAEATRRQALRGEKRSRFSVTTALNAETEALDLGDVIELVSTRFGLSAGVDARITSLEPSRATARLRIGVWA